MDVATIGAAMVTKVNDFGTQAGVLLLIVVGFALGYHLAKFVWGLVTTYLRARQTAKS